ncbi:UPF0149 family protein [Carnimonas nigrificans]|uniref:UPF0149 family protein n=1 Tax=Carnimonas nigrificans TaxID=64323 RepID=UPI000471CD8C|nr:YecA family protein [Carnimonas nigrificans]
MNNDPSSAENALEFSDIADLFLRYGSLSSPSFFDGRMVASLAVATDEQDVASEEWLQEICAVLGVEQPHDREDAAVLLGWRSQARHQLADEQMDFEPLLPDELFSVPERAQSLKMWAMGFSEVIDEFGIDDNWSAPLREAVEAMSEIGALDLDDGVADDGESEADLLALYEHVRVTALTLYLECHPGNPQVFKEDEQSPSQLH